MIFVDNIPDIKEAFFDLQQNTWRLYNGKPKASFPSGRSARSSLIAEQTAEMDLRDSWSRLESFLSRFAGRGGYANLWVGEKETAYNIPIYFPHKSEQAAQGTGLSGPPAGYGIDSILQDKMTIYDLSNRINAIEAEKEERLSVWDRIGERLVDDPAVLQKGIDLISTLIVNGLKGVAQPAPQPVRPANPLPEQIPGRETDSGRPDIGEEFIAGIRQGFESDDELKQYLDRVATLFRRDPETMKSLIDAVAQQNNVE